MNDFKISFERTYEVEIFHFHNTKLQPVSFVLDWDSENGDYKKLLNRYLATVCEEPNEHSLVLAKPEETKYFHHQIPAFDIRYIEDVFRLKDVPDPNLYLIQNSCPVTYKTSDIYDCWYHQNKSWFDLVGTPGSSNDDTNKNVGNRGKWISCEKVISPNQNVIEATTDSSDNDEVPTASVSLRTAPNKRTRLPYSMREEIQIVKYIIQHNHSFDVMGKEMWQNMEKKNVCKIRTWQSMKERYLKHIKHDLISKSHKFHFLSDHELQILRQGLKIDAINPEDRKKVKSMSLEEQINEFDSN